MISGVRADEQIGILTGRPAYVGFEESRFARSQFAELAQLAQGPLQKRVNGARLGGSRPGPSGHFSPFYPIR